MPQITLKSGPQRVTLEADVHNGYLVEPKTKIPLLDETLLAQLSDDKKSALLNKLEAARLSHEALAELWRDGEVLSVAHERPGNKFSYVDFLSKLQNHAFEKDPIENALSPEERQKQIVKLTSSGTGTPASAIKLMRSLSPLRRDAVFRDKPDGRLYNIINLFIQTGTADDMRELLSLAPPDIAQKTLLDHEKTFFRLAEEIGKSSIAEVMLVHMTDGKEKTLSTERQLNRLKDSIQGGKLHRHFSESVYLKMLPLTVAACKTEHNTGAIENAYKLAIVFSKPGQAMSYLEKWTDSKHTDSKQPVHDALLFGVDSDFNRDAWAKLALEQGPEALKHLGNAQAIERGIAQMNERAKNEGKPEIDLARATPKTLEHISTLQEFSRLSENLRWAHLCATYGVSEAVFNKGLAIFSKIKKTDNTPDIGLIEGADIGKPGYYMRRLAPDEPLNLLIGQAVNCCNHIAGGATSDMAESHVTSPDAACYVIFKEHTKGMRDDALDKPVGKSTGWMSKNNNFVFNSWERLSSEYIALGEPFFSEAARRILAEHPDIGRVLLGKNRDAFQSYKAVSNLEAARSPNTSSYDAGTQFLIAEQTRSPEIEARYSENRVPDNVPPPAFPDLYNAIEAALKKLDLSPTQRLNAQKMLVKLSGHIHDINQYTKRLRESLARGEDADIGQFKINIGVALKDLCKDSNLERNYSDDISLCYSEWGKKGLAAFFLNVALDNYLTGIVPEEKKADYKPDDYKNISPQYMERCAAMLGGSPTIKEYCKRHPVKTSVRVGVAGALLSGVVGSFVGFLNTDSQERGSLRKFAEQNNWKENYARQREVKNPVIFHALNEAEWTKQFGDMDITDPEALRAKFGDKVSIAGKEMTVEDFVQQLAPALNTLEEIKKREWAAREEAKNAPPSAPGR